HMAAFSSCCFVECRLCGGLDRRCRFAGQRLAERPLDQRRRLPSKMELVPSSVHRRDTLAHVSQQRARRHLAISDCLAWFIGRQKNVSLRSPHPTTRPYIAIPQYSATLHARSSSASSPPAQPMNDNPAGQPAPVPTGTLICGSPESTDAQPSRITRTRNDSDSS